MNVPHGIKAQLDKLEHVIFANLSHEPAITLCEELSKIVPNRLAKFNFSDNGSASVECVLKMSFQYQYQMGNAEQTRFMCLTEGYHGETIGALSVGSIDLYAEVYKPMLMEQGRCREGLRKPQGAPKPPPHSCIVGAEAYWTSWMSSNASRIRNKHYVLANFLKNRKIYILSWG